MVFKRTWYNINKISSQKANYKSNEMHRRIQILRWRMRYASCIHSPGNHRDCTMWAALMQCPMCALYFCLAHRLCFSTKVSMQLPITVNQRGTYTRILSPALCRSPRPTGSGCNSNPTTSRSTAQCLITRTPQLLANLKGLSGNGISLDSQTRYILLLVK